MSANDRPSRETYLWDAAGEADAEIEALERRLSPLRFQPRPFEFDAHVAPMVRTAGSMRAPLRAAAAFAILIAGVWALSLLTTSSADRMNVVALAGSPRAANVAFTGASSLRAGQWLVTDADSRAEMAVGTFGTVKVDPDSRVRLVRAGETQQRLELARGSISAFITAPPRLFIVDTPAATAFDLGCAYRMRVDERGDGEIEVTLGWVSMESSAGNRASIVPFGAKCITRKGIGAGTPFFADATPTFIEALRAFDFEDGGESALRLVLENARERDSLTLWHLLSRTNGRGSEQVFNRLAELSPPPAGVTRAAIMRGDSAALESWRNTFIWSPNPPTSLVR